MQPHLKGLSASQVNEALLQRFDSGALMLPQVKLVSVYIARALPDVSPAIGES